MLFEKAKEYAMSVIDGTGLNSIEEANGKEITTPEVCMQCKWFLEDLEKQKDDDFPYYFNTEILEGIEELLKLMNFATGIDGITDKTIYEGLSNRQCFFYANIFGWRFKNEPFRFRYRNVDLYIPRKNAKTFDAGVIVLLLMLLEDDYSEFYSICLDRELAGEIKKAISQIVEVSPSINKYFKIPKTLSGKVTCNITKATYQARTSEANRNNSVRGAAIIADEFGAMKDKKNYNALKSGQRSVKNPLSIILTTAYAEDRSPMLEELDYLKKIYKGLEFDDRLFALVYYASENHLWDEVGLYMSNPLRLEQNYQEIRDARRLALAKPEDREEYLTKSMNHFVPKNSGSAFIDIEKFRLCKNDKEFNWSNKTVYGGLDLALSGDNVSFTILCYENGKVYSKSWAFIPEDRIAEKNKLERTDYYKFIDNKWCYACGDEIISYAYVEDFIYNLQEKIGIKYHSIGYDVAFCRSTAEKLSAKGITMVQVKQNHLILNSPIKLLKEMIIQKNFLYEENLLYEINFQNAKLKENLDSGLLYINKKANTGKIDMAISTVNAMYLVEQNEILNTKKPFGVQTIKIK